MSVPPSPPQQPSTWWHRAHATLLSVSATVCDGAAVLSAAFSPAAVKRPCPASPSAPVQPYYVSVEPSAKRLCRGPATTLPVAYDVDVGGGGGGGSGGGGSGMVSPFAGAAAPRVGVRAEEVFGPMVERGLGYEGLGGEGASTSARESALASASVRQRVSMSFSARGGEWETFRYGAQLGIPEEAGMRVATPGSSRRPTSGGEGTRGRARKRRRGTLGVLPSGVGMPGGAGMGRGRGLGLGMGMGMGGMQMTSLGEARTAEKNKGGEEAWLWMSAAGRRRRSGWEARPVAVGGGNPEERQRRLDTFGASAGSAGRVEQDRGEMQCERTVASSSSGLAVVLDARDEAQQLRQRRRQRQQQRASFPVSLTQGRVGGYGRMMTLEKRVQAKRRRELLRGLEKRQEKEKKGQEVEADVMEVETGATAMGGREMAELEARERAVRERESMAIFKECSGLNGNEVKETFPNELVELMMYNPSIASKIFKSHGPIIAGIVKAEVRRREREPDMRAAESSIRALRKKKEVADASFARQVQLQREWEGRNKGGREEREPEQPPEGAAHFGEKYWEVGEWGEHGGNEEMMQEEAERGVTVQDEGSAYSALTEGAMRRLRWVLAKSRYSCKELVNVNGCIITGEDLQRLRPQVWLNDEIVNAFLELVAKRNEEQVEGGGKESAWEVPRVRVINSFFYAKLVSFNRAKGRSVYEYARVKRWTRRFNVFAYDVMLIPINQQNTHWTLGVVHFAEKWVAHLDSLGGGGSGKVRENLLAWVGDEAADKGKPFVRGEWQLREYAVPQQGNCDDCGVFLCKFADFLARGWRHFTFDQHHINYFRGRIAHELLMGRVA